MLILRALAYTHRYFSLKTRETSRSKWTLWLKMFFAKKVFGHLWETVVFLCSVVLSHPQTWLSVGPPFPLKLLLGKHTIRTWFSLCFKNIYIFFFPFLLFPSVKAQEMLLPSPPPVQVSSDGDGTAHGSAMLWCAGTTCVCFGSTWQEAVCWVMAGAALEHSAAAAALGNAMLGDALSLPGSRRR